MKWKSNVSRPEASAFGSRVHRIGVIDTHTGGEPTRVVVSGGPDLGTGTMAERKARFASQFDTWRQAITCEPRGSECMVGAILTEPERNDSVCGVIFFNNVGYLNMCGHGTIGIAVALAHTGRVGPGRYAVDTPVGQVWFQLLDKARVQIENVPSYRYKSNVSVPLPGGESVIGDIAWGGNWFFLCPAPGLAVERRNLAELNRYALQVRQALKAHDVTGEGGAEIDHVELVGPALNGEAADARNYVLCPGGEYDRSPCGTGTSAKVACLAAAGKLTEGQVWRQASVIGSRFEARYKALSIDQASGRPSSVQVSLVGAAWVNAEAELILDPADPFCMGIGT